MGGSVSLVDGHIDGMTNYNRIRTMSIEEMAKHIFYKNDILTEKICHQKTIAKNKNCPHNVNDNIPDECCINCVIEWLNSEVRE